MKVLNQEMTNEMLKGLTGDHIEVGIENVGQFLQQNGVLVKVNIGRIRNYIEVNPKIFGVDVDKSQELGEFFKEYIKNGSMTFIPNSDEKVLHNIEAKVRTKKDRMALGYNNEYMTLDIYKEFAQYVKEAEKEYLEKRDLIVSKWDDKIDGMGNIIEEGLITKFKKSLKKSLEEMNAVNGLHAFEQVISKLPSKEDYINSFYLKIKLSAFPIAQNLDLFDEEISEQIKNDCIQDSINSVNEILGNTLSDCFTVVNNLLVSYDKGGKIAHKTMAGLKEGAKRISQKNLFKSPMIESIAKDMISMSSLSDADEIAEKSEVVLSKIYGYASEVNLISKLDLNKSVLSEEELDIIYKSFKMEMEESTSA